MAARLKSPGPQQGADFVFRIASPDSFLLPAAYQVLPALKRAQKARQSASKIEQSSRRLALEMTSISSHPLFAFLKPPSTTRSQSLQIRPPAPPAPTEHVESNDVKSAASVNEVLRALESHGAKIDGLGKTLEELTSRVESLDQAEKKRSLAVQGELDDVQDQLSTFATSLSSSEVTSLEESPAWSDVKSQLAVISASLADLHRKDYDAVDENLFQRHQKQDRALSRVLELECTTKRLDVAFTPLVTLAPLLQAFLTSQLSHADTLAVEPSRFAPPDPVSTAASARVGNDVLFASGVVDNVDPFLRPPQSLPGPDDTGTSKEQDRRKEARPTARRPTLMDLGARGASNGSSTKRMPTLAEASRAGPPLTPSQTREKKRGRPTLLTTSKVEAADTGEEGGGAAAEGGGRAGDLDGPGSGWEPRWVRRTRRRTQL